METKRIKALRFKFDEMLEKGYDVLKIPIHDSCSSDNPSTSSRKPTS
jgi:hypothetical protein